MRIVIFGLMIAGLAPIGLALRANRGASLSHALVWAFIAWISWGITFLTGDWMNTEMEPMRYCALCLTGCAGVAVLGARRPHVFAWNFVVLGLLSVMVLPLVETLFIGTHPIDGLRIFFLTATLAVSALNYLPTRMAPAAALLLFVAAGQLALLYAPHWLEGAATPVFFDISLMAIPWIAWICWLRRGNRSEFDQQWLSFRDRWGLVWSQRVREQFNYACQHAGVGVHLTWRGLQSAKECAAISAADEEKQLAILRAILHRFIATPNE